MKRLAYLPLLVLFISALVACAKSKPYTSEIINPGNKVGDFIITTGQPGNVTYHWQIEPTKEEKPNKYFYTVDWGTNLNITVGIYDDTHSGKLDPNWSALNYEMFIGDHPVNLPAFGTIEADHPLLGKMRHWNVVIVATKPGKISVREAGKYEGESLDSLTIITVLPP